MQAYRYATIVNQGGKLVLEHLPLQAGVDVEVIILVQPPKQAMPNRYPLHNVPITYLDPTAPVAENDWEALQ
ncbi:MAG: hypothetical protein R3C14_30450 [Caldilineaceae bacterium]